jgi:UPF0271 protein
LKTVDLNVDLAEGFEFDENLLDIATSANICCGVHAGSQRLALEVLELCEAKGVRPGAHPGYDDRDRMGRQEIEIGTDDQREFVNQMVDQVQVFSGSVAYVKPHGAFYHQSLIEGLIADSLTAVLAQSRVPLMGFPSSRHPEIASRAGVAMIKEGFIDRAYEPDGRLRSRALPGAVLQDEKLICDQALRLAETHDSLCIHGDTPGCVEIALMVRAALEEAGYEVSA